MDETLRQTQRNDVFRVVSRAGFDPNDFYWEKVKSSFLKDRSVSVVRHRRTDYSFIFDSAQLANGDRTLMARFTPGESFRVEHTIVHSWAENLMMFDEWLGRVKRETAAPNLWEEASKEKVLAKMAGTPDLSNEPFTEAEQARVSAEVAELRRYLIEAVGVAQERQEFVIARLGYLEDAAKRQGQRDWVHTLLGVLFTIIVGIDLAPQAAEIFRFAGERFAWLVDHLPSLP